MSSLDAAIKIASDFGLSYEHQRSPPSRKSLKRKLTMEQQFAKEVNHCFMVLSDYLHLMKYWKEKYKPEIEETEWNHLFVEALQNITKVESKLDILLDGSIQDKAQLIIDYGKEVEKIERRIKGLTTTKADATVLPDAEHGFVRDSRGSKKLIDKYYER